MAIGIEYFLRQEIVNASDILYGGLTPLLTALILDMDYELLNVLLQSGVNPKLANKDGTTPLIYAISLEDQTITTLRCR